MALYIEDTAIIATNKNRAATSNILQAHVNIMTENGELE